MRSDKANSKLNDPNFVDKDHHSAPSLSQNLWNSEIQDETQISGSKEPGPADDNRNLAYKTLQDTIEEVMGEDNPSTEASTMNQASTSTTRRPRAELHSNTETSSSHEKKDKGVVETAQDELAGQNDQTQNVAGSKEQTKTTIMSNRADSQTDPVVTPESSQPRIRVATMKVERIKTASDEGKIGQVKLLYDGQTTSPRQLSNYYGYNMEDIVALFQTNPCSIVVQAIERLKEQHKKRSLPCISKKEWIEEDQRFRGEEETDDIVQDLYIVAYIKLMQGFEIQLGGNYFSVNPKDGSVLSRFERLFVTHRFLIACRSWLRNTNQISNMYHKSVEEEITGTVKASLKRNNETQETSSRRRRRRLGSSTIQTTWKGPGRPRSRPAEQEDHQETSTDDNEDQNKSDLQAHQYNSQQEAPLMHNSRHVSKTLAAEMAMLTPASLSKPPVTYNPITPESPSTTASFHCTVIWSNHHQFSGTDRNRGAVLTSPTFDGFIDWIQKTFNLDEHKQGLIIPFRITVPSPPGLPSYFAITEAMVDRNTWSWALGHATYGNLYFTFETTSTVHQGE